VQPVCRLQVRYGIGDICQRPRLTCGLCWQLVVHKSAYGGREEMSRMRLAVWLWCESIINMTWSNFTFNISLNLAYNLVQYMVSKWICGDWWSSLQRRSVLPRAMIMRRCVLHIELILGGFAWHAEFNTLNHYPVQSFPFSDSTTVLPL